jgi:hypothetical protein
MVKLNNGQSGGGALPFFVGLIFALFLGWAVFPQLLFSKLEQPVYFSHPQHTEDAGMSCEDCHYVRDDGSFYGLPTTESCAECHSEPLVETEAEMYMIENYIEPEKEIEWLVYQYQPDNVYFSHVAHTNYECTECHPNVAEMESPPPVYQNKLTHYTKQTMKMWKCEQCHAEQGAANGCYVCHH